MSIADAAVAIVFTHLSQGTGAIKRRVAKLRKADAKPSCRCLIVVQITQSLRTGAFSDR
jgi:hypothetical protein